MLGAVAGLLLLVAGYYGYNWWTVGRFEVTTDDAYVQADFAILAPKVTGYVAFVPAKENATVAAGDPLVVLEDGDYRNALAQAEAQLAVRMPPSPASTGSPPPPRRGCARPMPASMPPRRTPTRPRPISIATGGSPPTTSPPPSGSGG